MHSAEFQILSEMVLILGLSLLIILLFNRFKLPSILGFLVTGIIIGPYGLKLIKATQEVSLFSEIGIIFLLFVIGMEFSLKELLKIKRTVLIGGSIQVVLTIAAVAACGLLLNLPLNESFFLGFLIAMSSTAIVLKLLQERGEVYTPHGKVVLAILIFQDLVVVPLLLITPLMAGQQEDIAKEILVLLAKIVGVLAVLFLLTRYLVPWILKIVVRTKNRELFLLTIVALCFATAWMTASVGLSLALGAFFAGLIISESPYSHQATALVLPFREIFLSFFFVSVGMLLDLNFFLDHIWLIHLFALGAIVLKFGIASIAALLLRYPLRTTYLSALALAQVGEFAFLLAASGLTEGILSPDVYQYFLAVSIISMGITPVIVHFSGPITEFLIRWPMARNVLARLDAINLARQAEFKRYEDYRDHLVIIGCGVNGKNLSKAARFSKIQYLIVETDPAIFEHARRHGEPILFGDATSDEILSHLKIETARMIVIAISDIVATKKIVSAIRRMTTKAYLIVRTRSVSQVEDIIALGADEVIPQEFETSVKIFTVVLEKYLVPDQKIAEFADQIRSDHYEMFRKNADASLSEPGR